jgi:hypothetical protein
VDGKVTFNGERVSYKAIYDLHEIGDTVTFDVLRNGKEQRVEIKIAKAKPFANPAVFYGERPRFITFAGLVFTALTRNYLQTWGNKWYLKSPFLIRFLQYYKPFLSDLDHQSEIVVLAQTLPHPVNTYANEHQHNVLIKVNAQNFANLEELSKLLTEATGEFVRFDFYENNVPLVLPLAQARAAQKAIEAAYQVDPDQWLKGREVDGAVKSL